MNLDQPNKFGKNTTKQGIKTEVRLETLVISGQSLKGREIDYYTITSMSWLAKKNSIVE